MFETYRMLGREHEADLAREAATRARAAEAQDASPGGGKPARGLGAHGRARPLRLAATRRRKPAARAKADVMTRAARIPLTPTPARTAGFHRLNLQGPRRVNNPGSCAVRAALATAPG
jgi:hypothetical protein